jgi:tetratricopeptide (TPR) repeat protein
MSDTAHLTELRFDQRRRWQAGERVTVETYLEQEPGLNADPDAVLELICNEMVLREEAGAPPSLEEYLERFPQHAAELRIQFEVHQLLEASPTSGGAGGEEGVTAWLPAAAPPLAPGASLPGYEILGELGRGGMGVVYRARHLALKRVVALKVILAGTHAGARERAGFHAEAEAVARLQHPNIVQIYDIAEHNGLPYFSLELVDGHSLEHCAGGKQLPVNEAAQIIQTLARAIHYAHQQGVIHRDLKPSNILLSGEGTPKITDFGVAKLLDATSGRTRTGDFIGTPHYMAPEQAAGKSRDMGPAADVYALGAILYQLLTGRTPFQGNSVLEVLEQVRSREPAPPSHLQAKVPRDLDTICLKCLEKSPQARYTSAHDLAEDLGRFLAGEPIRARPPGWWERLGKWSRRHRTAAALVGVSGAALVSLLLLGLWYTTRLDAARARHHTFLERRDDAMFYGVYATWFENADVAENLKRTRTAVESALAAVDLSLDTEVGPAADPFLSDRENAELAAGCYQLLLVWAEAVLETPAASAGNTSQQKMAKAQRTQVRQALDILDRAARLVQPTQAYHLRRARYLLLMDDRPGAERERARADRLKSAGAIDHFALGEERFWQRDFDRAIGDFRNALAAQPDDFWSRFFLAWCYLGRGTAFDLKDAAATLEKCLEQRPGFLWTYLFRALVHEKQKAFSHAETDYRKVLALEPGEDARYVLYHSRGRLRLAQGKLDLAAADLLQAIALKPGPYPHLLLGLVYQKQNKLDESNQELEQTIKLQPPAKYLSQCYHERARNLYSAGQYSEAVKACDQATQVLAGHAASYFTRACALLKLKRYPEVTRALDQFLSNKGQAATDFYRVRGQARLHLRDYSGSMADLTRVLEREPDAEIYRHRGWAFYFADAWKPALGDFEEAIRRDGENIDARIGRGLCRVMLGDYRAAVVDAENTFRRGPSNPEMVHNIACVFALAVGKVQADPEAGDKKTLVSQYRERAIEAIRRALALLPPDQRPAFWRDKVLPDTALDAIRACEEFKKLATEYSPVHSVK